MARVQLDPSVPTLGNDDARLTAVDIIHFDYDQFPDDVAEDCRQAVRDYAAFNRRSADAAFKIGRRLIAIRGRLEHGQFLKWIELEFGSKSSAYRFITFAERVDESVVPKMGSLDLGTINTIASAPAEARQEILGRIASGDQLPPQEIKSSVAEARAKEKHEKAEAKLSEEQRKRRDRNEHRTRMSREKREAECEKQRLEREARRERQLQAARLAVEFLKSKLDTDALREFAEIIRDANNDPTSFEQFNNFQILLAHAAGFDVRGQLGWRYRQGQLVNQLEEGRRAMSLLPDDFNTIPHGTADMLRACIHEVAGLAALQAELVMTYASIADDAGLAYAIRKLAAYARSARDLSDDLNATRLDENKRAAA